MSWRPIGRSVAANRPLAELRRAYRRTDIIAVDLDQCIFRGYTQTELGRRVARRLLWKPRRRSDRRFLPRLGLGGLYFALKETKRFFGLQTPMHRLVARYERVMRGIPEAYILEAARSLPPDSYEGAAETVALLADQAPTGIISLGLDVAVRAYMEQFRSEGRPALSFFDSNVVLFQAGADGTRVFARYDPAAMMTDGQSKAQALERRMAQFAAAVPATIGHSNDDVALARLCRARGGLAIGFNPPPSLCGAFDLIVRGPHWEPVYAAVSALAGARTGCSP